MIRQKCTAFKSLIASNANGGGYLLHVRKFVAYYQGCPVQNLFARFAARWCSNTTIINSVKYLYVLFDITNINYPFRDQIFLFRFFD